MMISGKEAFRWAGMMSRCYDPNNTNYPRYGGRGIAVCERWHDYRNFIADIGEIPKGSSIDRIDNDGNYEPSNVRLANSATQANNRTSNHRIEYRGKNLTISQWARKLGIKQATLFMRLMHSEWDIEKVMNSPLNPHHTLYTFEGQTMNLRQWAAEKNLLYQTLHARLSRSKMPFEKAITLPIQIVERRFEYRGKTLTLTEWSKELGISRKALERRIHRGMSVEEAFSKSQCFSRI